MQADIERVWLFLSLVRLPGKCFPPGFTEGVNYAHPQDNWQRSVLSLVNEFSKECAI